MHNKILVIPDVHSRDFWKEPFNKWDGDIIFLGDYCDPYIDEFELNPSELWDQTWSVINDIINSKKEFGNRITLLLGNHDMHYLNPDFKCSRFDSKHFAALHNLYSDNRDCFQISKVVNECLFAHSVVTKEWLGDLTLEQYLNGDVEDDKLMECGPFRWGDAKYSGPMWCDVRELADTTLNTKYYQIFGHTQVYLPIITEYYACLDCQKCFVVDTEHPEDSIEIFS